MFHYLPFFFPNSYLCRANLKKIQYYNMKRKKNYQTPTTSVIRLLQNDCLLQTSASRAAYESTQHEEWENN